MQAGLLRFSCTNLGVEGRCQICEERRAFCRDHPTPAMFEIGGSLLPRHSDLPV